MPLNEKKIIFEEISNIIKNIDSLNNQHLLKKISLIKKKYSTLILDTEAQMNDLESYQETNISFSSLNDNNDSSNFPEATILENNENTDSDTKDNLMGYINQIWNELDNEKDSTFIDYLQKVTMWLNITPNITDLDIESKHQEVKISFDKYSSKTFNNDNYKDELQQLCSLLLNEISTQQLPLTNDYSNTLKKIINKEIIPWLNKTNLTNNDKQILDKINYVNLKCQEFYDLSN